MRAEQLASELAEVERTRSETERLKAMGWGAAPRGPGSKKRRGKSK
ncbi:MAG: hypothetical protein ACREOD_03105 [Candidatus Dormibacteria bacterium]